MTAALSLGEAESTENAAQLVMSDRLVGRPAEEALKCFAVSSHSANVILS